MDRLAQDDDYKVRSAAARAIGGTLLTDVKRHVTTLMLDDNWHVREPVLHGILSGRRGSTSVNSLASAAIDLLTSDDSYGQGYPSRYPAASARPIIPCLQ
jgi:HEAT repeats